VPNNSRRRRRRSGCGGCLPTGSRRDRPSSGVRCARAMIPHLRAGLAHPELSAGIQCPQHVSIPLPTAPSWCTHPSLPYFALKADTSFPSNSPCLPSVHTAVSLFSAATGASLASVDGSALTLLRTAVVSALAASLLASPSCPPSVLALEIWRFSFHVPWVRTAERRAERGMAAGDGCQTRGDGGRGDGRRGWRLVMGARRAEMADRDGGW
jgi:hypothetical protein